MATAKWHVFPLTVAPFPHHPVEYNKKYKQKIQLKITRHVRAWALGRQVLGVSVYKLDVSKNLHVDTVTHYRTRQLRSGRSLQVPSIGSRTLAIQPPAFFIDNQP